jgi:AcrR family transcriptional regulator
MSEQSKYNRILDALQILLVNKNIQNISVQEIAQTAGIGKGSIYYYFSSKNEILEALIERNYKKALETAKNLAGRHDIAVFTRMALIFHTCTDASAEFLRQGNPAQESGAEKALLHHKYLNYLITELKPELTSIIEQGIEAGEIHFDYPSALAEIVLIILTVKLDNSIVPASEEEITETIRGLISLLEKGTGNPAGSLNFLMQ